jgi:transmembrane protein DUF3566
MADPAGPQDLGPPVPLQYGSLRALRNRGDGRNGNSPVGLEASRNLVDPTSRNGSPEPDRAGPVPDGAQPSHRQAGRVSSRVTVRHVDVWTVFRVSLIFYLLVLVVIVVASVLLWYAADDFGSLASLEKSIRTLFDLKTFTLHPGTVAAYVSVAGIVLTVAGTLANVLAAVTYNLICDVVGGVRIEVESPSGPDSQRGSRSRL